jgi:hypothetical protein
MPRRKRRTKKQPKAAPALEPIAKAIKKRRRRQPKPAIEPVIVTAEPKTVMQLIFEAQRTELVLDMRAKKFSGVGKVVARAIEMPD